jgi:energy-coupling factor transporter ATP-binding protein EcfA2
MAEESPKPEVPTTFTGMPKWLEATAVGILVNIGIPGGILSFGWNAIKDDPLGKWQQGLPWLGAAAVAWVAIEFAKRVAKKIQKGLDWLFVALDRIVQSMWAEVSDRFESEYYQRLVGDCRDFEGRGFNAGALRLEDVYVPLNLVEKSAGAATQDLIRQVSTVSGQQQIGALIRTLNHPTGSCRRLIILGAPGSGKSTLLRHLTLMYALRRQRQLGRKVPRLIPVLVRLRDVYATILEKPDLNLVDVVEGVVKGLRKTDPLKLRAGWFGRRLRQGRCLVMLDGLDEIPEDEDRQRISQWVDEQLRDYAEVRFILTSRPDAYRRAPLRANVIESEVQPLSPRDRNTFIRNWCRNWRKSQTERRLDAAARDKVERQVQDLVAQIEAIPSLRLMATNPLLLVLMAKTHSEKGVLSKRRVEIYKDVCHVLLEGRSRLRSPVTQATTLSADRKQAILQGLALAMTQAETLRFSFGRSMPRTKVFDQAATVLSQQLERVPNCALTPEAFITTDEVGVRELISDREQEGIYEFAHRTFQEYLTAVELTRPGQMDILCGAFAAGDMALDWWREVLLFYAALADATPLLEAAIQSSTVASLSLAYECLQVTESVDPAVKQELESLIDQGLQSPDPDHFMLSVNVLLMARLNRLHPDCREATVWENALTEEVCDPEAVTVAEYRLFRLAARKEFFFIRQDSSIPDINPRQPMTGIDIWAAYKFCRWFMMRSREKFGQMGIYYRPHLSEAGTLQLRHFRVPEKYHALADLLATGEWRKADQETYRLMITTVGKKEGQWFDREDLESFPCEDLLTLDRLWVQYSNGKFGFSVQKKIYVECGATLDGKYPGDEIWDKFGDRVGWRKDDKWLSSTDLKYDPRNSPIGELPVVDGWFGGRGLVGLGWFFSRVETCKL